MNSDATKSISSKWSAKQMAMIGLMAAVICILGPLSISIPVSPVPISLGLLGVAFAVYMLGMKKGTLSVLIYLLLGLVGLPVFSSFSGGIGKLFGPTGGYLIGYIPMALIVGFFVEKWTSKIWLHLVGLVLGTASCYLLGTLWLSYQAGMSFSAALAAGVIPFIPADIVKILIVLLLGSLLRKRLLKAGLL